MRNLTRIATIAWRRLGRLALCALASWLPGAAEAGGISPCATPFVFEGSAVNVVVLPYVAGFDTTQRQTAAGTSLALLIQQDSLIRLAKYKSIGVVGLVPDDRSFWEIQCTPDGVMSEVLARSDDDHRGIQAGKGLVVVWGRIYEEHDDIYVQTYASFLRNGVVERINLPASVAGSPDARFTGRLPAQSLTFPPHLLTREDLADIEKTYERLGILRQQPTDDAPGSPLLISRAYPISYQVLEVHGEWMHIAQSGRTGWLHASGSGANWPLQEHLPELKFIDGLVGYLEYQEDLAGKAIAPDAHANAQLSDAAFRRYDEAASDDSDDSAASRANAYALRGAMALSDAEDGRSRASKFFYTAAALEPQSAQTRNLTTLIQAAQCCSAAGNAASQERSVIDGFLGALALSPSDRDILSNLETFYASIASTPGRAHAFGAKEASIRLQQVRDVEAGLAQK